MPELQYRKMTFYEKYIKRILDIICSLLALTVFGWLYIVIAILVKVNLGSPVLFKQPRPGKDEKVFNLYKFRTMTDEKDENGNLLPDDVRLTKFGAWLRNSSLDEIPEAINILKGDMSVIGPRPQLVRDMVFMTPEQRQRHTARPGLSGLAQVSGRNAISWEGKLATDLDYIGKVTFLGDLIIVLKTVEKAFLTQEGADAVSEEAMDFGDWLLKEGKVSKEIFDIKQNLARKYLGEQTNSLKFSVAMSVYQNDNPNHFDRALESVTINQTIKPTEIVLVVDGPVSKGVDDVIEKYKDYIELFTVIRLKENKGLGNALRIAVESAKYELIARMDSDDVAVSTRFEEELLLFEKNPNLDIAGGNISEFIDDENNIVAQRNVPCMDSDIKDYMRFRCAFNHVTVMFKKTSILSVGNYKDLFWNEDYYLWIRMLENNMTMSNTGTILVNVRVGREMYKRRGGLKYFKSELFLQKYMLDRNIINLRIFIVNVLKRFIVQVMLTNQLRGFVFKHFARTT